MGLLGGLCARVLAGWENPVAKLPAILQRPVQGQGGRLVYAIGLIDPPGPVYYAM